MLHGQVLIWVGIGIIGILVLTQFLRYPGKTLVWLVKSAVLGCLFVFAVNWIGGQYFHFHLPFNAVTAATAGILGIPGVAALITLKLWIFPG